MDAQPTDSARLDAFTRVPIQIARAAIAACLLGDEPDELRVGDITLHPHQRSAVARIGRTIAAHGGALLCDDVGLGKTYVALAIAAGYDSLTVVAPATLLPMWRHALGVTHLTAELISAESLGRTGPGHRSRDLIVVDEAHHFRNACTRRYAVLAGMCTLTPVLLLSATPLHNSRDDVAALVALFRGSAAYAMNDAELGAFIVRRHSGDGSGSWSLPVVEHRPPRVLVDDEALLDMILSLPAPVPPSDGGIATSLVVHGLVRQWVSSNASLVAALRRRIARSHSLLTSLDAGRYPTTAELSAWIYADDAVQLAFAELILPATTSLLALATALREHVSALNALLSAARLRDDSRLSAFVREIMRLHPGERIIAFSCYAETAEALYASVKGDGHAALLTARGARIASGLTSRHDLMGQFGPDAGAVRRRMLSHQQVDFLIATDLLSEGVNLQEASVLIHLDLPWTSARIGQRIGRLARMGSRHASVVSYSVCPPARAEAVLHEIEIITRKSGLSSQLLGGPPGPDRDAHASTPAAVASAERVREIVSRWRRSIAHPATDNMSSVFAVAVAPHAGAFGVWLVDGTPMAMGWTPSGGITTDPASVRSMAEITARECTEAETAVGANGLERVLRAAVTWYDQHCAWRAVSGIGSALPHTAPVWRNLARVADAALASADFAHRSDAALLSSRIRNAAASPLPLAVEWSLESLADNGDDASVNTILDLVDEARMRTSTLPARGFHCVALIVGVVR